MPIELTNEQSQALEKAGTPSAVTDPRTRKSYVLVSVGVFERIKAIVPGDDYTLSETYPAQMDSAMKAGWNDPVMDEYNDYDVHRKP